MRPVVPTPLSWGVTVLFLFLSDSPSYISTLDTRSTQNNGYSPMRASHQGTRNSGYNQHSALNRQSLRSPVLSTTQSSDNDSDSWVSMWEWVTKDQETRGTINTALWIVSRYEALSSVLLKAPIMIVTPECQCESELPRNKKLWVQSTQHFESSVITKPCPKYYSKLR